LLSFIKFVSGGELTSRHVLHMVWNAPASEQLYTDATAQSALASFLSGKLP
jgi:hypothetical protein